MDVVSRGWLSVILFPEYFVLFLMNEESSRPCLFDLFSIPAADDFL